MMKRLADDIEILERAALICTVAINHDDHRIDVPVTTLDKLAEEIEARIGMPTSYRLIDDEAAFLVKAARRVVLERLDGNLPKVARWSRLAELALAAIALDLTYAQKSLAEISADGEI